MLSLRESIDTTLGDDKLPVLIVLHSSQTTCDGWWGMPCINLLEDTAFVVFGFYVQATYVVISLVASCDSAHSWIFYSAGLLDDQVAANMT